MKKFLVLAALAVSACGGYEADGEVHDTSEALLPGGGTTTNCYVRMCQCYSCEYVSQTYQSPAVPQSCETRCQAYAKSQAHAGCSIHIVSTSHC